MATSEVKIALNAEDNTRRAFRRANSRLDNLKRQVRDMGPAFERMAMAGTIAFAGVAAGIGEAIGEASKAQEIERTFSSVFDETEGRMRDFVSDFAQEFGRAESQIQKIAATSAGVLVPAFDLSEQKISEMTRGLTESAVALAAYDPRIENAQQAMEGFTQALIGNRARVFDWGFQVREAQLKAAALEKGIISQGETLTQQQKAMLTFQKITSNTAIAQDVLRKSQGDLSEQLKRINARWLELRQTVGRLFLGAATDLIMSLRGVMDQVTRWVKANPQLAKTILIATTAALGFFAAVSALSLLMLTFNPVVAGVVAVFGALSAAAGFLVTKWDAISSWIEENTGLISFFKDVWKDLTDTFKLTLLPTLKEFFGNLEENKPLLEAIGTFIGTVFVASIKTLVTVLKNGLKFVMLIIDGFMQWHNFLVDTFQPALDAIADAIEQLNDGLGRLLDNLARADFSSIGEDLKGGAKAALGQITGQGITAFADGGIVKRPTMGLIGEAGPEAVVPLDKAGGMGGVTVNINGGIFGSDAGEEIGDQIIHRLKTEQRLDG